MATLGNSWTEIGSGSWSSGGATLSYIIEAKLDSQSTSENKSYISTRARTVMTGYYVNSYNVHMSCTGCSSYDGNNSTIYSFTTKTVLTGSVTVTHNANGTGSLSMSGSCTGNLGMSIKPSGSISLPTINRYSVITSFNNFTIEDGFSIGYTDYLGSKTLTLTCKMGSTQILSKTYTSSAGSHTDTISFTADQLSTIYSNIGDKNKSAKFTLTLATSGISPTSSKEATGSLKAGPNAPSIDSYTVTESNSTMIQCGVADTEIVRYLSSKKIVVTASAKHGATISNSGLKVRNGSSGTDYPMTKSGNVYEKTLSNLTSNTFVVTVTDSRGLTASTTITCTIKNYSRPSVEKIDFDRTSTISSTGYIRPSGTFWVGSAGSTTNSVTWKYRISSGSMSDTQETTCVSSRWSGEAALASGTLLRENAYECTVTVFDAFGQTATATASIGPAKLSAWIGKETMRAEGFVGAHWIGLYKVGDIFLTLNTENPADRFGGVWELISAGKFLLGSDSTIDSETGEIDTTTGTYKAGDVGGTSTHRHMAQGNLRAAIGAINNSPGILGYQTANVSSDPLAPSTSTYAVQGSWVDNGSFNHYTPVYGETAEASTMPPYLVCYVWQKIS